MKTRIPLTFKGPPALVQWVIFIGTLATVASLIFLYMEATGRLTGWMHENVVWADTALCVVMLAEWFTLLALSTDRWRFVRRRWIDLIASLPLVLIARPLRVLRLLRLIRFLRSVALLKSLMDPWQLALDTPLIRSAVLGAMLLILATSVGIMDFEKDNPQLDEFHEAVWWSVVTASTVGYGDRYPESAGGRVIAGTLMLCGLAMFGAITASLSHAVLGRGEQDITNRDLADRLEAVEQHLVELLEQRGPPPEEASSSDAESSDKRKAA